VRRCAVFLCGLATIVCLAQRPAPPSTGPAFFVITSWGNAWQETFTIKVDDPASIQKVRDILNGVTPGLTIGVYPLNGPACYNPPWTFHVDPSAPVGAGEGWPEGYVSTIYNLQQAVSYLGDLPIPVWVALRPVEEIPNPGCVSLNPGASRVGFVRGGSWTLDFDGNHQITPADRTFTFGGLPGDIPITGDWNGSGTYKAGVYRNGQFVLDYDGDGQLTANDRVYTFTEPQPGDVPVVGRWRGGPSWIGIFRGGSQWLLDWDGNGVFEPGKDKVYTFGGEPGDIPVVGDWTHAGAERIGIFRKGGIWMLDANGNGTFDGTGPAQDLMFRFDGSRRPGPPFLPAGRHPAMSAESEEGDVPVVGDWNGGGFSKVGIFRQGVWILDVTGGHRFDLSRRGPDLVFQYGLPGDRPVVGRW